MQQFEQKNTLAFMPTLADNLASKMLIAQTHQAEQAAGWAVADGEPVRLGSVLAARGVVDLSVDL